MNSWRKTSDVVYLGKAKQKGQQLRCVQII